MEASRFCTNRRELAGIGPSLEVFMNQGLTELGDRLGPILWQFMATKKFDPVDFEAFLKLLPKEKDGLKLRHVLEPRHASFCTPEFIALARKYGVALCLAAHADYPMFADPTADFIYARLQTGSDDCPTAYEPPELDAWARRFKQYAAGETPADLDLIDPANPAPKTPRDVYAFVIHEGKIRAPAAAMALIERVKG